MPSFVGDNANNLVRTAAANQQPHIDKNATARCYKSIKSIIGNDINWYIICW